LKSPLDFSFENGQDVFDANDYLPFAAVTDCPLSSRLHQLGIPAEMTKSSRTALRSPMAPIEHQQPQK
jgi:hypothetical protein